MPQEAIDQTVRESTEKGHSVWEILERFLAIPSGLKREQAIASRIRRANFPTEATLESYDWSFNPSAQRQVQVTDPQNQQRHPKPPRENGSILNRD